jgi:hypothetical protein
MGGHAGRRHIQSDKADDGELVYLQKKPAQMKQNDQSLPKLSGKIRHAH